MNPPSDQDRINLTYEVRQMQAKLDQCTPDHPIDPTELQNMRQRTAYRLAMWQKYPQRWPMPDVDLICKLLCAD